MDYWPRVHEIQEIGILAKLHVYEPRQRQYPLTRNGTTWSIFIMQMLGKCLKRIGVKFKSSFIVASWTQIFASEISFFVQSHVKKQRFRNNVCSLV